MRKFLISNFKFLNKFKIQTRQKKFLLISLGILGGLLLVFVLGVLIPGIAVVNRAKQLEHRAKEVKEAVATKNLGLIKDKIAELDGEIKNFEQGYRRLFLLKIVPGLRRYYFDGERAIVAAKSGVKLGQIVVESVEPYQDFLGLKGASESGQLANGEKTTEERINFLVESIEGLKPRLDEIEKEIEAIKGNIDQIDPQKYPEKFRGKAVRAKIVKGKKLVAELTRLINEGRPLIEQADWLLGKDEPRYYLFLFQNDGELRPTGGFWTAYGILKVEKGKISPLISEDIYTLDARFNSSIPAPRPIKEYHKNVYYWYLRDMNLSPDFEESVKEFISHYQQIKGAHKFDSVIAIDTQVLVDLLKVLGRIGVPGWGNFTPEPDNRCWGCPQVVYQLELLADKPLATFKADRKGFLGPLMHSIIANALGSPKEQVSKLVEVGLNNLKNKHILIYFLDPELQKAARSLKIAGKIESFDGDYFHLNDANFAGAKSNLFIEQTVKQEYQIDQQGKIVKKVIVTYKNTAPASDCNLERGGLCLNGLYRNWFRFYVPEGSKLIKMTGTEVEPKVYQELGKTVFEGFYGDKYPLYPQGSTRVTIEYELPFTIDKEGLKLLIQKQPGTKDPEYQIIVNGEAKDKFKLIADKVVVVSD